MAIDLFEQAGITYTPKGVDLFEQEGITPPSNKQKKSVVQEAIDFGTGSLAAAGDIISGIGKIGVQTLAVPMAKIARPDLNLNELWKAAGDSIEGYAPSFGNQVPDNKYYQGTMLPFQKLGEAQEYLGDKAGELTGSQDVAGAVKLGLNFAPIPGAKLAGKAVQKVAEKVDPGLQIKPGKPTLVDVDKAVEDFTKTTKPQATQEVNSTLPNIIVGNDGVAYLDTPENRLVYDLKRTRDFDSKLARNHEQSLLLEDAIAEQAQKAVDERQAALEFPVKRQQSLDFNAAERKRQLQAPVPGLEEANARAINESIARTQDLNLRGQQLSIVEDFGSNDPVANMPHMRVDENGIPIRADLSIEAQQLQNPLQRNLWGDELPVRTGDNGIPLTQALDRMPNGEARTNAIQSLSVGPKPPKRVPPSGRRGEAGAIDIQAISEGLTALKNKAISSLEYVEKFAGAFDPKALRAAIENSQDPKSRFTVVLMSPDEFHKMAYNRPEGHQYQGYTQERYDSIKDGLKGDGLRQLPHLLIKTDKNGKEVIWGHEGRHRMDVFKEMGIDLVPVYLEHSTKRWGEDPVGKTVRPQPEINFNITDDSFSGLDETPRPIRKTPSPVNKQRGAIDLEVFSKALEKLRGLFGTPTDTVATPTSPEKIAHKQEVVTKLKTLGEALPEWAKTVSTFEEALVLGAEAKDIKTTTIGKNFASGLNHMAAWHKNPVLNYARTLFNDARGWASEQSKRFITDNENGIGSISTKLSNEEKVIISKLITSLDKRQIDYTDALGTSLGLSTDGKKFMERLKAISEFDYNTKTYLLQANGKKLPTQRKGYAPGVFSGSYVSRVVDKDGNIVGIIAAESPGEFQAAKDWYSNSMPGVKFSANSWAEARRKINGNQNRGFVLRDMMEILNLLSNADGDVAKAHINAELAIRKGANQLWAMDVHEKQKKGVAGNQGNKPWLSDKKNAQDRFDSIVRYYEEAFEYYSLQKPIMELDLLSKTDQLQHLTNTFKYLDEYIGNATGRRLSQAGTVANIAFDIGSKLLEYPGSVIPGVKNNVGPGKIIAASNLVKNKMSHLYMGLGNYMFTLAQLAQPLQTGVPMLQLIADRLNTNPTQASKSLTNGARYFLDYTRGKEVPIEHKKALEWAESRGMLDFSELERAYEGHKTKVGRMWDNVAEANMKIGERLTRPPMFLGFVDLLLSQNYPLDQVLYTAENLTNQTMIDYHKYERPLVYGGLGVVGGHAGGLTTFKHGFLANQAMLLKEGKKGNLKPAMASALGMVFFAGITGFPAYEELDKLYQAAKEAAGAKPGSIGQDFMKDMDTWAKQGVISAAVGLNLQGKFSAANMVPDTVGQALFPHLTGAYDIGEAAFQYAKDPNKVTGGNLAMASTPSGFKRWTEELVRKDSQGNVLDKHGNVDDYRSPEDWAKTRASGSLVPTKEAMDRANRYQNRVNQAVINEQKKSLSEKYRMAVITGDLQGEVDVLNKYQELTGVAPVELLNRRDNILMEAQMTAQERLQGIPRSPQGIQRYENFNR